MKDYTYFEVNVYKLPVDISKTIEFKNDKGYLHRTSGPARIESTIHYYTEAYYLNGVMHRDDGPAEITYSLNGIKNERWYRRGCLHRDKDLPAAIDYLGKNITSKTFYKKGYCHRSNGPAIVNYLNNQCEFWENGILKKVFKNNVKTFDFKSEKPTYVESIGKCINHYEKSFLTEFHDELNNIHQYYKYGELHNIKGPAIINGNKEFFFYNGKRMKSLEAIQRIERLNCFK